MITRQGAWRAGALLLLLVAIATITGSLAQPAAVLGRASYALDFEAPLSKQWQVHPLYVM
jgi:hypothetical protein